MMALGLIQSSREPGPQRAGPTPGASPSSRLQRAALGSASRGESSAGRCGSRLRTMLSMAAAASCRKSGRELLQPLFLSL